MPSAKSVSQLPICASRCASLSCSARRVASACSSWRSATARSRSIAAISRFAIDSTKARSSSENAARRRLHATSSPNAVVPRPDRCGHQAEHPLGREPGRVEVVSAERSALSSVSPAARMRPSARRRSGEGTAAAQAASRRRSRGPRCRRPLCSRAPRSRSLASVSWSTRAASSSSSATGRPREGERAERADGRLLGQAAAELLPPAHALGDVLRDHDRARPVRRAWPRARNAASTSFWPSVDSDVESCALAAPAPRASAPPARSQAVAGMTSWRSRPTAARLS